MPIIKKEVEVDFSISAECSDCGAQLDVCSECVDEFGDVTTTIRPCGNCTGALSARITELAKAILETLDEHGDLADGDVCTLIKLKRVMGL